MLKNSVSRLKDAVASIHGKAIFERRARVLAQMIAGLLHRNATVLDVGTGNGQIAHSWEEVRGDITVEGIDVFVRDETCIPVRPFDGRTIPLPDKSVDVVTFVDVLHHTTDVKTLLTEAKRVARHNVVIKDHLAENDLDHAVLRLMDWVGNAPHGIVLPYNYLARTEWQKLFDDTGLVTDSMTTDVPLYPAPLSSVFGRELHFIASLTPDETLPDDQEATFDRATEPAVLN